MERWDSPPCRVFFDGWETTTEALQRAGWQISAMQHHHGFRQNLQLIMKNPRTRLHMMTEALDFDFHRWGMQGMNMHHPGHMDRPEFYVRQVFVDGMVQIRDPGFSRFKPIDAEPQFGFRTELKTIEDFNLFTVPLVRTKEIIIEPQSVAECLSMIEKLQAPDLAEIQERNRMRERRERYASGESDPLPAHTFHAQIITLAA